MVRVIAEIGVNHNGNIDLAKTLITEAKLAGADAVKMQYFHAQELATSEARLARYQRESRGMSRVSNQLQMLKELEVTLNDLLDLRVIAEEHDLAFFVSVFSAKSVSEVVKHLAVETLKIPSGEINNEELISAAAKSGLEIILSTGMSTLSEVKRAVSWVETERGSKSRLQVLQCTTNYPTEPSEVNLRAMVKIREELDVSVGFSDHTRDNVAALGAVALGAVTLEKHLTLDRGMQGPDHAASLTPLEFASLVRDVRQMTSSLGKERKEPTSSEIKTMKLVRKSPVAISPIAIGDEFSSQNLALRRPENGLDASCLMRLIGRTSSRDYKTGDPILGDELG